MVPSEYAVRAEEPASCGTSNAGSDLMEYNRDAIERGIEQWILGRNGERDRIVLGMYLIDGITYEEMRIRLEAIGYPLTTEGIKKIVKRRKEQLFRHM